MKVSAKIIPLDQRRRRALERAHAQEIKVARAAFDHLDAEHEPQSLDWPTENGSRRRVTTPRSSTPFLEGETP